MNNRKLMEYSRGRMDGLLMAEKIVREQGIEALQKEIKFRNEAGVHTGLAMQELNKATTRIKEMTVDTVRVLTIACLHDEFGFGQQRCQRFMDRMDQKADCLIDDFCTWQDYIDTIKEELNLELGIRYND